MPSSSMVQQYSGDDSIPKDRTEAEEISECDSHGLFSITRDMANLVVCTQEDCRLTEESSPEVPCNFSHDWVTCHHHPHQNISSLDLEQESSGLLHCMGGNENQEMVPLPLQTSVGALSASTSMRNMIMVFDKPEDMLIYVEAGTDGPFPWKPRRGTPFRDYLYQLL